MTNDKESKKAEYRSPRMVSPGDASKLTLGDGTVYTDSLGDTSTSYGKMSEAQPLEPAASVSEDKAK